MATAVLVTFALIALGIVVYAGAGDVLGSILLDKMSPEAAMVAADRLDPQALPFLIVPVSPEHSRATEVIPQPIGVGLGGPSRAPISEVVLPIPVASETKHDAKHDDLALGDETLIFPRVTEVPVKLLPGRLEVVEGEPGREDIRFVDAIGQGERTEFFIGRGAATSHRAITLRSPTVSRRHARLEFTDGQWTIANLSRTNPVVLNDSRQLFDPRERYPLADGDQIALGEVTLRFHAR